MSMKKITIQNFRMDTPMVTLGKNDQLGFSAKMLAKYDPDGTKRLDVFIDVEARQLGFSFVADKDVRISRLNQIRCPRIFKQLGVEGTGQRYPVKDCSFAEGVQCYIEVPDYGEEKEAS